MVVLAGGQECSAQCTSSLRASVAEARLENPDRDQSTSSSFFGTSRPFPTCLHKGKGASNFKGPVQASAVRITASFTRSKAAGTQKGQRTSSTILGILD